MIYSDINNKQKTIEEDDKESRETIRSGEKCIEFYRFASGAYTHAKRSPIDKFNNKQKKKTIESDDKESRETIRSGDIYI